MFGYLTLGTRDLARASKFYDAIAAELEELPLPYRFDVQSLAHIQHRPLLEHNQRVGILIYPAP